MFAISRPIRFWLWACFQANSILLFSNCRTYTITLITFTANTDGFVVQRILLSYSIESHTTLTPGACRKKWILAALRTPRTRAIVSVMLSHKRIRNVRTFVCSWWWRKLIRTRHFYFSSLYVQGIKSN